MSETIHPWKVLVRRGRFSTFEAANDVHIRYAAWEPEGEAKGTVVLLNGRSEFIEKYAEPIGELLDKGYAVWSKDWRGQGLSSRPLANRRKGHADSFDPFLSDLHVFLTEVVRPNSEGPYLGLGHSMGGHLLLRYLAERPGFFARAILSAPMVDIHTMGWPRGMVEGLAEFAVWLGMSQHYVPGMGDDDPYQITFSKNLLTSDPVRFHQTRAWTEEDPALALGGPTYGWMRAAYESIAKLEDSNYAGAIDTPVLLLSADKDRVVLNEAQERLSRHLPKASFASLPDAKHEIMLERDPIRARFWELFDQFAGPL
ncbi:MAG: alpha/beta fold hydrolase [Alphaproteobacteria bacterium]